MVIDKSKPKLIFSYGPEDKPVTVDLLDEKFLNPIGISRIEIGKIETHSYFGDPLYHRVDRTVLPSNYRCMGSISCYLHTNRGIAQIYPVLLFDETGHSSRDHLNVKIWMYNVENQRTLYPDKKITGHILNISDNNILKLETNEKTETIKIEGTINDHVTMYVNNEKKEIQLKRPKT